MSKKKVASDPAAQLAALSKENERLQASNTILNERVLELYTLYNVSRTLSMSLQVNELFDLVMNVIVNALNVKQYSLLLLEEGTDLLTIRASHGMPAEILSRGAIRLGEGLAGKVAGSKQSSVIPDLAKQRDHVYFPKTGPRKGSYLGVPLTRLDGRILGVLNAHKPAAAGFTDGDTRLFTAVAEQVAVAIDHALTFQQTQELMIRDELTNLHNRRYFFERFEREVYRAKRYERTLSVIMIDIDHFKNFNDAYGHLRGDQALKTLARTLEACLRTADGLARYGGEEFLVLLPETRKEAAAVVAEKLRARVETVNFNEDAPRLQPASLTITAGIASLPADAEEPLTLLDLADKALYYGKAQGRNRVCTEIPEPGEGNAG